MKIHAACHDGYTTMFAYLRCQTPKKPLSELDGNPYFSPEHPRGQLLQRLLAAGARADRGNRGKKRKADGTAFDAELCSSDRFRTADMYALVKRTGCRTADET